MMVHSVGHPSFRFYTLVPLASPCRVSLPWIWHQRQRILWSAASWTPNQSGPCCRISGTLSFIVWSVCHLHGCYWPSCRGLGPCPKVLACLVGLAPERPHKTPSNCTCGKKCGQCLGMSGLVSIWCCAFASDTQLHGVLPQDVLLMGKQGKRIGERLQ